MSFRVLFLFFNVRPRVFQCPSVRFYYKQTIVNPNKKLRKQKTVENGDSLFSYGDLYRTVFDETGTDR